MKIILSAFKGLMIGQADVPEFKPVYWFVMEPPAPRIMTKIEDSLNMRLDRKRVSFEITHETLGECRVYKMVEVN